MATAGHVPRVTMSPHRPTAPGRHPTPRQPPQLLPCPPRPPHLECRCLPCSARSTSTWTCTTPTGGYGSLRLRRGYSGRCPRRLHRGRGGAHRCHLHPPPARLPPASPPPPVRFLARAPLPATTVAAATISAVCSRTTQMRKSRRLATASALSRGSGPSHRLETAAPRVTRAAQAHAASLAQQSRPSRGARGEGEEGEEEAQWQMGAVPVGADEGCAVAVAVPAELPQPSCRGASPPVRVH